MSAGNKCNKAAEVIRSAIGHFLQQLAHFSYWIMERNMMNQGSRTRPFKDDREEV